MTMRDVNHKGFPFKPVEFFFAFEFIEGDLLKPLPRRPKTQSPNHGSSLPLSLRLLCLIFNLNQCLQTIMSNLAIQSNLSLIIALISF